MSKKCLENHCSCSGSKLTLAIITRVLFAAHNIISIGRVLILTEENRYGFLGLSLLGLLAETLFTIVKNKGEEWKWFCPSVFFFLAGSVPSIWILEFDLLERRAELDNLRALQGSDQEARVAEHEKKLEEARTWVLALEQFLLFVLIVGRWLLPKGEITRDQLSQLLLVYIATAADIIEFFDSFNSDESPYTQELITAVLTLWSWSLIQFSLVLTSTRGFPDYCPPKPPPPLEDDESREHDVNRWRRMAKMRSVVLVTGLPWPWGRFNQVVPLPRPQGKERVVPVRPENEGNAYPYNRCECLESEMWAVVVALLLQDGPFLILRLILIAHYHIFNHLSVFFTSKNALVLTLQVYRLIVVHQEKKAADKRRKLEQMRALEVAADAAGQGSNPDLGADIADYRADDPYEIEQYREAFQVLYRR